LTTIKLVILGLLYREPMHGYEIKSTIEKNMGDWTDIKFGSIYFALSKLVEESAIEVVEEVKEGNRPAKTIYRITKKGKDEYMRLLRKIWGDEQKVYYPFDIAVYFMKSLPKNEVGFYLSERIMELKNKLKYYKEQQTELDKTSKKRHYKQAIMDHTLLHMEAELYWLQKMLQQLDEYYV